MSNISSNSEPQPGMGLASVILGSVGTLLFFLPVLGLPLGAVGLAFGIIGLAMAFFGSQSLRWCVAGVVVSAVAVGIGFVLNQSPQGFLTPQTAPREERVPSELYVPPPARG